MTATHFSCHPNVTSVLFHVYFPFSFILSNGICVMIPFFKLFAFLSIHSQNSCHAYIPEERGILQEESRQVDVTIYLMSSQAGGLLMPWNVTLPDRSAWQFHSVGFLMSLQVINCHCWFDDDYVNCGHFDSSPALPFHSFENMVWACTVWRELNTGNLVSLTQCQQCRPLKQTAA